MKQVHLLFLFNDPYKKIKVYVKFTHNQGKKDLSILIIHKKLIRKINVLPICHHDMYIYMPEH